MDQAAITAEVRRWIGTNPQDINVKSVSDADITAATLRGVNELWNKLKAVDPAFSQRRTSLTSNTNVFAYPSACLSIMQVWDMLTNAGTITGAANNGAGLVRIALADHGFGNAAIVRIHDITGTTEANGLWQLAGMAITGIADNGSGLCRVTIATHGWATSDTVTISGVVGTTEANAADWTITKIDANTFDLQGSTFTNAWVSGGKAVQSNTFDLLGSTFASAWVSGGKAYEEKSSFSRMGKISPTSATQRQTSSWYPKGKNIVVDSLSFADDVVIDYDATATAVSDIPADFHEGLVGYCVLRFIRIPTRKSEYYESVAHTLTMAKLMWDGTMDAIQINQHLDSEATPLPTGGNDDWNSAW